MSFREQAQVRITCEVAKTADELNEKYVHPLENLMSFVSDREQAIERFSVWRGDAPDREIVVVGQRVGAKAELAGLDIPEMGALCYPDFVLKAPEHSGSSSPSPVLAKH